MDIVGRLLRAFEEPLEGRAVDRHRLERGARADRRVPRGVREEPDLAEVLARPDPVDDLVGAVLAALGHLGLAANDHVEAIRSLALAYHHGTGREHEQLGPRRSL